MTEMLEKAVTKIKQLPAEEQDAIAALILEELEDEARWDAAFHSQVSADPLAVL